MIIASFCKICGIFIDAIQYHSYWYCQTEKCKKNFYKNYVLVCTDCYCDENKKCSACGEDLVFHDERKVLHHKYPDIMY